MGPSTFMGVPTPGSNLAARALMALRIQQRRAGDTDGWVHEDALSPLAARHVAHMTRWDDPPVEVRHTRAQAPPAWAHYPRPAQGFTVWYRLRG